MLTRMLGIAAFAAAGSLVAFAHNEGEKHKTLTWTAPFQSNGMPGIGYDVVLAEVVTALETNDDYVVVVTGHTRTRGPADANQERGQRFATRMEMDLLTEGVHIERITAQSLGETQPLSQDEDESDNVFQRRLDRVEIVVQNKDI